MRTFLILSCLATAYAASLGGYDYERNGAGNLSGSVASDVSGGEGVAVQDSGHIGGGHHGGGATHEVEAGPAEFTKEFFTYSAPEGDFDDSISADRASNSLKKSLRVIFIKGPESSGIENAALQLAKSASDDRTAIYVLNKQADISDLSNKLNQLHSQSGNKPEVHFVKYRTNTDADHAQRTIQSQYDNLGGSSVSHNGGVAPVLDFASKAAHGGGLSGGHGGAHGQSHGGSQGSSSIGGGYSGYLPPNRRVQK